VQEERQTVRSFEDSIQKVVLNAPKPAQWETPKKVQTKKQKKEQNKKFIEQQREEEKNDPDIKIEQYCKAMFPLLTGLRKKLRLLLKHHAAWPVPQQFVTTFYKKRKEENREELRDQLLESLFYLRANMRFCHNTASFRIFDLCEATWTYIVILSYYFLLYLSSE
jgi:hypothetical protein